MFRNFYNFFRISMKNHGRISSGSVSYVLPSVMGIFTKVSCDALQNDEVITWSDQSLGHEFLIRQATTVNVNAATQLITVTLVAIQDTNERLRQALSKEISLMQEALEWGQENTPQQHWDDLVAVRGSLSDLAHNLRVLYSYMEYAEKIATVAAEISYLSGNIAASDAICERVEQANRACRTQKQLTHDLQQESLELQQLSIVTLQNDEPERVQPKK